MNAAASAFTLFLIITVIAIVAGFFGYLNGVVGGNYPNSKWVTVHLWLSTVFGFLSFFALCAAGFYVYKSFFGSLSLLPSSFSSTLAI
jgi:hypothetical protein